ncbi:hypothetical protein Gohar_015568 [Gossypium harknessii]|uniref:Uncharacterized protein n=2 Tax=Gossypium TaxID=3633 RepID=A0A7J8WIX7_GOSAI|nr:hypothetical protein [Gossypium aridum]MBA0790957.1 hypothetical protein [Gossypium harknessii]
MVHIAVMVAIMQLHKCPHQFHKLPVMVFTRLQHIQCRAFLSKVMPNQLLPRL